MALGEVLGINYGLKTTHQLSPMSMRPNILRYAASLTKRMATVDSDYSSFGGLERRIELCGARVSKKHSNNRLHACEIRTPYIGRKPRDKQLENERSEIIKS